MDGGDGVREGREGGRGGGERERCRASFSRGLAEVSVSRLEELVVSTILITVSCLPKIISQCSSSSKLFEMASHFPR